MTYVQALNFAIDTLDNGEVTVRLMRLRDALVKRAHDGSEASKEKRKEKTAAARANFVATVIPVLRNVIVKDMTAKEIYEAAKPNLDDTMSVAKVQNILLREMAPELIKTETKGKPNTYRLAASGE